MSYVVFVKPVGEQNYVPNGLRYPTFEAADQAAFSLMCRWFGAESYEIRESTDPVNVDANGNLLPEASL